MNKMNLPCDSRLEAKCLQHCCCIVVDSLCALVFFPALVWHRYYSPHFTDQYIEAQKGKATSQSHTAGRRARSQCGRHHRGSAISMSPSLPGDKADSLSQPIPWALPCPQPCVCVTSGLRQPHVASHCLVFDPRATGAPCSCSSCCHPVTLLKWARQAGTAQGDCLQVCP